MHRKCFPHFFFYFDDLPKRCLRAEDVWLVWTNKCRAGGWDSETCPTHHLYSTAWIILWYFRDRITTNSSKTKQGDFPQFVVFNHQKLKRYFITFGSILRPPFLDGKFHRFFSPQCKITTETSLPVPPVTLQLEGCTKKISGWYLKLCENQ